MITIWDGYAIDADERQFILGKPVQKVRKDGRSECRMAEATYHSSLASALQAFYRSMVRECIGSDTHTLCNALAQALHIEKRIRALVEHADTMTTHTEVAP